MKTLTLDSDDPSAPPIDGVNLWFCDPQRTVYYTIYQDRDPDRRLIWAIKAWSQADKDFDYQASPVFCTSPEEWASRRNPEKAADAALADTFSQIKTTLLTTLPAALTLMMRLHDSLSTQPPAPFLHKGPRNPALQGSVFAPPPDGDQDSSDTPTDADGSVLPY